MKRIIIILLHAFVGWALCGAIIGIGFKITSEENTLIIHAIGVPVIFGIISFVYFHRFNYTTPIQTASIFLGFIVLMDFFLVGLIIQGSLDMFTSILGTWIPFILIFLSTYFVGKRSNDLKNQNNVPTPDERV
jgi:hypothetical protein